MNSAITFPAFENGHEVRLVGSPLDREIIDGLRKDNYHITLKRTLHDGIRYYQMEEIEEALKGADLILGGVSSFGLDWFCEEILPIIPEEVPLLTVTKGMLDNEDGMLEPYPYLFARRQPEGKHINLSTDVAGVECAVAMKNAYALGVTLESIVIATRTARAVRKLAQRGVVELADFPLLMHVDSIINEGKAVDIPWNAFTSADFSPVK